MKIYVLLPIARFLLFIFRPRPRYRPHQLANARRGQHYAPLPDWVMLIEARRWNYRYGTWVYDGTMLDADEKGVRYATTSWSTFEDHLYDVTGLDYGRPFPILRDSLVTS
jgi:hypothetical protein